MSFLHFDLSPTGNPFSPSHVEFSFGNPAFWPHIKYGLIGDPGPVKLCVRFNFGYSLIEPFLGRPVVKPSVGISLVKPFVAFILNKPSIAINFVKPTIAIKLVKPGIEFGYPDRKPIVKFRLVDDCHRII